MKLDELQTRLTHLLTALSNEDSRIIQGFTKAFEKDGPIPGIKLFKHLNIFLEREYCEY